MCKTESPAFARRIGSVEWGDVAGLAMLLEQLMAANTAHDVRANRTRFDAMTVPKVSVVEYLRRLYDHCGCTGECFVLAVAYLERLLDRNPQIQLRGTSVHRLLVTALTIAIKVHDDDHFDNHWLAKVGCIRVAELNELELLFLKLSEWRVHVPTAEFQQCFVVLRTASNKAEEVSPQISGLMPGITMDLGKLRRSIVADKQGAAFFAIVVCFLVRAYLSVDQTSLAQVVTFGM